MKDFFTVDNNVYAELDHRRYLKMRAMQIWIMNIMMARVNRSFSCKKLAGIKGTLASKVKQYAHLTLPELKHLELLARIRDLP